VFNKNHTNLGKDYTEDDIIKNDGIFKAIELLISMLE
jgi:hypothetical protein